MWYFRPQQSLRRTDNTSILSSETHEKAALSGRLADVLRLPKGQLAPAGPPAVPWDSRRPAVHSLLRQVFPGQQSPPHIPPFLCCQGPLCKRSMWSPFTWVLRPKFRQWQWQWFLQKSLLSSRSGELLSSTGSREMRGDHESTSPQLLSIGEAATRAGARSPCTVMSKNTILLFCPKMVFCWMVFFYAALIVLSA